VDDNEEHRMRSIADRARVILSDDRIKQAGAATRDAAARAQEATKAVTRKVAQEDAWDQLRSDVELLTQIARAHHALIADLVDRVAALEAQAGTGPAPGHDG
jgi:hypothetical protein